MNHEPYYSRLTSQRIAVINPLVPYKTSREAASSKDCCLGQETQFGSPRKGAYREVECINWILNLDSGWTKHLTDCGSSAEDLK